MILTGLHTAVAESYISDRSQQGIRTFSFSTIMRILKVVRFSGKKSLAGLDDTVADGVKAFDTLSGIVNVFPAAQKAALNQRLSNAKRFLKIEQYRHVVESSDVAEHCSNYLLSDPKDNQLAQMCNHLHLKHCAKCLEPFNLLNEIKEILEQQNFGSHELEVYEFDFIQSKKKIISWFVHNVRAYRQNAAKIFAETRLLSGTCVIVVRDWGMKVLPMLFREGQISWYSKKGMSVHLSVAIFSKNGKLFKRVYVVCLTESDQGLVDTLDATNLTLAQLKKDEPQLERIVFKSDNASCYVGEYICILYTYIISKIN